MARRGYVPIMGDAVEVRLAAGDDEDEEGLWIDGVLEEYKRGRGWCVYLPATKRKRLVPARAVRPVFITTRELQVTQPSGEGASPSRVATATRTAPGTTTQQPQQQEAGVAQQQQPQQQTRKKSVVSGPLSWWQEGSLVVERAKSSRSRCGGCGNKIGEASLRVGIKKRIKRGHYFAQQEWFHLACFETDQCPVGGDDAASLSGHHELDSRGQAKLARFVAKCAKKGRARSACPRLWKPAEDDEDDDDEEDAEEVETAATTLSARGREPAAAQERFARACRIVVAQFVHHHKSGRFDEALGDTRGADARRTTAVEATSTGAATTVVCPITGRQVTWEDCHVHHQEPSFDSLVRSFAAERQINIGSVRYHLGAFIDQQLAHDFHDYHNSRCHLQLVHKDANLGLLKRKQPSTATSDDDCSPQAKKLKKEAIYEDVLNHVLGEGEHGWNDPAQDDLWAAKLGDLWAKQKRERGLKCSRAKRVVGAVLLRRLRRQTVPPPQCGKCGRTEEKTIRVVDTLICRSCRLQTYASKGWAKKAYSLNERDLGALCPEVVPNPVSVNFADMKLYLKNDLLALARRKHGPEFTPNEKEDVTTPPMGVDEVKEEEGGGEKEPLVAPAREENERLTSQVDCC